MRLTTVILIASLMQVSASTFGQRITINQDNASIKSVFREIRKQSGYSFFYDGKIITEHQKVSVKITNVSVDEALNTVLNGLDLTYKIEGKIVSIKKKEQPSFFENLVARFQEIDVTGKITDESGAPLAGANIRLKGTTKSTITDTEGKFTLKSVADDAILEVSFIGYESREIKAASVLNISLKMGTSKLDEINVVSTGYQTLSAERTTGSFVKIDSALLERNVGPDLLSRLNGVTPSLSIDQRSGRNAFLNIRGVSTILANDQPLIVVDNFPYHGDINTINPNNIESITILRDAAAASIWGVRAGNGVIVITTKKGKSNRPLKINFNGNATIGEKPDLFYVPQMTTPDLIDVERDLFGRGYYDANLSNTWTNPVISPVVATLNRVRKGDITQAEGDAAIAALEQNDIRDELNKYFYNRSLSQQYAIDFSGGSGKHAYYLSAGYDRNRPVNIGRENSRLALTFQDNFQITDRLTLDARIEYTQSEQEAANGADNFASSMYRYTKLKDDQGNPLPVSYRYNDEFLARSAQQGFLNWTYSPINDVYKRKYSLQLKNIRTSGGLTYNIGGGFSADLKYQYESQGGVSSSLWEKDSYYVRNMVNQYSVFNGTTVTARNVPEGQILSRSTNDLTAHNGRSQVNYNKGWERGTLSALGGFEVRQIRSQGFSNYLYGYNSNLGTSLAVDHASQFAIYPDGYLNHIPFTDGNTATLDRYRSYYSNAAYTLDEKYTLSASARVDQSNLFGVKTNQRSAPLWSVGAKWEILKEKFIKLPVFSTLRLRATYGYNGNIAQTVTAYTTARFAPVSFGAPLSGRNNATIVNPPNPNLTWERTKMFNIGIDFGIRADRISGRIEHYQKRGVDLFGTGPIDPTQGLSSFTGNIASMKGKGWDIELITRNVDKQIRWTTNLLFSHTTDEVTDYTLSRDLGSFLLDYSVTRSSSFYSPVVGRPLFGIYSYPWAGLNPENGDPQGYLNGVPSSEYGAISAAYTVDSLRYHGRATPPVFGFIRNTFEYKGWALSVNIGYRFGYYFRAESIDYATLYLSNRGHADYAKRWQMKGDELTTHVPSAVYPSNSSRDSFYAFSSVLVEKADNIRLQDIRLSYTLPSKLLTKINLSRLEVYGLINNVGIIWKASKGPIDPDSPTIRLQRTGAIGARITF